MPTMNQLFLGAQRRLPKKRKRDKKTPALQGNPQKRGVCLLLFHGFKQNGDYVDKL